MSRQSDDFLMPGDRLRSKNGISIVIIEGLSPHGYRGTAYFRVAIDDYQEQKVLIGNNWKASYTRAQKTQKGEPIPIESQLPPYPHTTGREGVEERFRKALKLMKEGVSQLKACNESDITPATFRRKLKEKRARIDAEKMANVEDEFNK